MTPRLLTEEAARDYLGGIDPRKLCAPRRFGRAIRWDVEDLNAALDAGRVTAKPSESGGDEDGFDIMGGGAADSGEAGMRTEMFIVICPSEDGEVSMSVLTGDDLRQRLIDKYWGDAVFLPHVPLGETVFDLAAQSGLRIIKGEQITPTPRTVATDWNLP